MAFRLLLLLPVIALSACGPPRLSDGGEATLQALRQSNPERARLLDDAIAFEGPIDLGDGVAQIRAIDLGNDEIGNVCTLIYSASGYRFPEGTLSAFMPTDGPTSFRERMRAGICRIPELSAVSRGGCRIAIRVSSPGGTGGTDQASLNRC
jgi:hypothetical protein